MRYLDRLRQTLLVAGTFVALVLAAGIALAPMAAQAQDIGENFSIDETIFGGGGTVNDIDFIDFSYLAVVEQENFEAVPLDGDMFFEEGFISWSSYRPDTLIPPLPSDLGTFYNVYGLFSAEGTAVFNSLNQIEVTFTKFVINFFVDDDLDSTLTLPSTGGFNPNDNVGSQDLGTVTVTDTTGTVVDATTGLTVGDDDVLIATASVLGQSDALLLGTLNNGSFEVILTDFGQTFLNGSFFFDPVNFYNIMNLDGVTTTVTPAGSPTQQFVSTLVGSGNMFFTIPEPSTLGLFGVGLIALGFVMTRRQRRRSTLAV